MAAGYNNNDKASNDDIHRATCDGCQSATIYSDRYKCLQCYDYDLCGTCFEEGRHTKEHLNGHAVAHFKVPNELFGQSVRSSDVTLFKVKERFAEQQHHVRCSGCKETIVGARFKCDKCCNYDLCSTCLENQVAKKKHTTEHPMILMDLQNLAKINVHDIRRGGILGQGGFGTVYKAIWLSKNRQVACKVTTVTRHNQHLEEAFRQELAVYADLSGAYILKTFGYGEHQLNHNEKEMYLIMEYMNRGSLNNVIANPHEKLSLRRKLNMAFHIASGMHKLHSHGMVHRDIRPDNILVATNYTAKIGDMGICHVFNPAEHHDLMGCIPFMPPEFYSDQYDQSLDVFTYGLTVNQLFTEKIHHFDEKEKRITLTTKSPILSGLITRCVIRQPSERPLAAEILATLKKYQRAADKYIEDKYPSYKSLTTQAKNEVMIKFYGEYRAIEKTEIKPIFAPPPSPRSQQGLGNQYFDDMMKEFDNLKQMKLRHEKGHKLPTPFFKLMNYFKRLPGNHDVNRVGGLRLNNADQLPRRSLTPPLHFDRARQNLHEQFHNMGNAQPMNMFRPHRFPNFGPMQHDLRLLSPPQMFDRMPHFLPPGKRLSENNWSFEWHG